MNNENRESKDLEFENLKKYVDSDQLDIYTVSSIMVKDYGSTHGWYYQILKAVVCLVSQLCLPPIVIYDTLAQIIENYDNSCPGDGNWRTRTTGCLIALFI